MSSSKYLRPDALKCCEIVERIQRSVIPSTSRLYLSVDRARDREYARAAWMGNNAVLSVVFAGSMIFVPSGLSIRRLVLSRESTSIMNGECVA